MLPIFTAATPESLAQLRQELAVRRAKEFVLLFSMGSQFDHLIVQALSRLGVFCLLGDPATLSADDVRELNPAGIIVSGGPASVEAEPPPFDANIFDIGIPTLGVCLGFQMWAKHAGAKLGSGGKREFGVHEFLRHGRDDLFDGVPERFDVLQTHGDAVLPSTVLTILGSTDNAPVAAARAKHLWGVQFHPEVSDTQFGQRIYDNFCGKICGITERFPAENIAEQKIRELREKIGGKKVLIALSGGSDSSVVAYLLKHALEDTSRAQSRGRSLDVARDKSRECRIRGIYIRGIDRPDDEAFVKKYFGSQEWIELEIVDATEKFLDALAGKTEMRDKRVAMRGVYKDVLERELRNFGADFIVQGTLYTDLRESGLGHSTGARVAEIKVHHNTGISFSVPELLPLSTEVKDSARAIGRAIGVPEDLLVRHPFPGPGLVVRIEGEVTKERLSVARAVDGIYIEELRAAGLYENVWQAGAVLTRSQHTESKGDDAGVGAVVALWAVWSVNGFTARFAKLPWEFLEKVSRRITNEVRHVGAVVYRVSDKPPATIEWG